MTCWIANLYRYSQWWGGDGGDRTSHAPLLPLRQHREPHITHRDHRRPRQDQRLGGCLQVGHWKKNFVVSGKLIDTFLHLETKLGGPFSHVIQQLESDVYKQYDWLLRTNLPFLEPSPAMSYLWILSLPK